MLDKDTAVAELSEAANLLDTFSVTFPDSWNKVSAVALEGALRALATHLRRLAEDLETSSL